MTTLRELVEAQANDDGLWFNAQTAPEAYLQQELRRLHAAVEAALAEFGASLTDPTNISVHQTAEQAQPVAWLYQHSETGRTRVVMQDQATDCDAAWLLVGPLFLAPPAPSAPARLTDEDFMRLLPDFAHAVRLPPGWRDYGRAVEAEVRRRCGVPL